ncbi:hypothetical protein GCM10010400_33840 [Streptomyces aculeolatus]
MGVNVCVLAVGSSGALPSADTGIARAAKEFAHAGNRAARGVRDPVRPGPPHGGPCTRPLAPRDCPPAGAGAVLP